MERLLELARRIAVEPRPVEPRHHHLWLVAGHDDVRLERLEAPFDDLAAERRDVIVGGELLGAGDLPRAGARRAAVRPVDVDGVPRRPAEELVHGNVERLRLQIEQRVLDPADRLLDH